MQSIVQLFPITLNVCVGFDDLGNCNQTEPVTIQATRTGLGHPSASSTVLKFGNHGFLLQVNHPERAMTVGSLNDQQWGPSLFADLIKINSATMTPS